MKVYTANVGDVVLRRRAAGIARAGPATTCPPASPSIPAEGHAQFRCGSGRSRGVELAWLRDRLLFFGRCHEESIPAAPLPRLPRCCEKPCAGAQSSCSRRAPTSGADRRGQGRTEIAHHQSGRAPIATVDPATGRRCKVPHRPTSAPTVHHGQGSELIHVIQGSATWATPSAGFTAGPGGRRKRHRHRSGLATKTDGRRLCGGADRHAQRKRFRTYRANSSDHERAHVQARRQNSRRLLWEAS